MRPFGVELFQKDIEAGLLLQALALGAILLVGFAPIAWVFSQSTQAAAFMGGLSSEREVSLASGNAILAALKEKGYHAVAVDVDRDVAGKLHENRIDVAFIALHGRFGEDGAIQGMLEVMDIPYTGWEVPTGYAYLAVPVSAFLMLLFTLSSLYQRLGTGNPS